MQDIGVYCILCRTTGRRYIGSSAHLSVRQRTHKARLRAKDHHSPKLQRAWDKYGESDFEFSIIEYVDDVTKLLDAEQHWIEKFDAVTRGFNISPKAGSCLGRPAPNKGMRWSEEAKRRQSERKKEYANRPEEKARLASLNLGRPSALKGRKHMEETIKKIREANSGRRRTEETKRKMSLAKRGCVVSDETRGKIREKLTGRTQPVEIVEKRAKSIRKTWESRRARDDVWDKFKFLTVRGERMLMSDALKLSNVTRAAVLSRIKHGWSEEQAILTPRGEKRS